MLLISKPLPLFFATVLFFVLTMSGIATEPSWPQWRGANRDGVSTESGWQASWPAEGPKRLWEAQVDRGMSSFAVVDGRVYTQGFRPGEKNEEGDITGIETVYCLDAQTGKEVWHYSYKMGLLPSHVAAANTPCVVEGRVYTMGDAADVHCLNAATGELIWSHNMAKEFGAVNVVYGYAASPLVSDGVVVVPLFTGKGQKPKGGGSYPVPGGGLIAFSAETGEVKWQNKDGASAWATLTIGMVDGKRTIVTYTGKLLLGIDPVSGATLWKDETVRGTGPWAVATIPVIVGDKIIVPTHVRGIYCVRVKDGKVETLWMREKSHWFENIAVWDGCVYAPSREAELDCIDLEMGKDLWHSRIGMPELKEGEKVDRPGDLGGREPVSHGGALMIADGKILMLNRNGFLVCAEVSAAEAKILSTAKILVDSGSGWHYHNTPTLCGGRIYMRNVKGQVVCLDVSGG